MKIIDQAYLINQYLDLKISSIPSRILASKSHLILLGFLFSLVLIPQISFSEVFVPSDEFIGYFDSNGIYTVVGNVKNKNNYAVIPTIIVSVQENDELFSKTIRHVPLAGDTEIPFKIKFPNISNDPILFLVELTYERTVQDVVPIVVLYDETLIKYDDGHLTGRIQNTGEQTVYNPKIFAVIHGYDKVLDIGQNIEFIEKIEPGEILDFSMYPDPSINDEIFYYSCFAPVDTTVIPITTKKNEGDFDFRYDSGAWYSAAKFDETGTILTIKGYNSYPLETYANFEFPPISGNEKFFVTLNDEPVEFIQSMDEMGFWHVAFSVGPHSQGTLKISGFDKGLPPELSQIPQWIKNNAGRWVTNQISNLEFLEGINFLFEKQIVSVSKRDVTAESQWNIPFWVKTPVSWWYEEKITDDDFLNIIENLVKRKIIVI